MQCKTPVGSLRTSMSSIEFPIRVPKSKRRHVDPLRVAAAIRERRTGEVVFRSPQDLRPEHASSRGRIKWYAVQYLSPLFVSSRSICCCCYCGLHTFAGIGARIDQNVVGCCRDRRARETATRRDARRDASRRWVGRLNRRTYHTTPCGAHTTTQFGQCRRRMRTQRRRRMSRRQRPERLGQQQTWTLLWWRIRWLQPHSQSASAATRRASCCERTARVCGRG